MCSSHGRILLPPAKPTTRLCHPTLSRGCCPPPNPGATSEHHARKRSHSRRRHMSIHICQLGNSQHICPMVYIPRRNQASILLPILRPIRPIHPIPSFRHRASPKTLSPATVLPDQGLLTQTFSCRDTSIALSKNILCKREPYAKCNPRPSKML